MTTTKFRAISFGETESVLDSRMLYDYGFCPTFGEWIDMPYDINAVNSLFRATSHHTSAIITKRNILASDFIPHPLLSRREFSALVLNLLTFSNAYLFVNKNRLGGILNFQSSRSLITRRKKDNSGYVVLDQFMVQKQQEFTPDQMIHLYEPDIGQDFYGVPNYLSSVNSILLNEASTLFRRRYYKNGAHAGYILHITDPLMTPGDVDALEESVLESKGSGNFKNLFIYMPNGKKESVQVIPLAEVAAKDDFMGIKRTSRDDQLAGHRMPPQLIGVVPENAGGFGDIEKAARVFYYNEILYLQNMLKEINDLMGIEIIRFNPYPVIEEQAPKP